MVASDAANVNLRPSQKDTSNLRFSIKDSEGNTLSPEQQAYFKNSKVRDDNGNLLVMYHGTPYGGFTQFRTSSYFTQDKSHANVFHSPSASSIRGRYDKATSPQTYAVYLNIEKPFDTRRTKERNIFNNEYYRNYGMGTSLMESGLPDWLDGIDLQEFLEEKGYGYDGLILDEGGTGGYGEEVKPRGFSYVAFSPEQIKSIDNQTPTSSPDIRFSLKDTAGVNVQQLMEENERLTEALDLIKEQFKLTKGHKLPDKQIDKLARRLLRQYTSSYDFPTLSDNLRTMFDYIANTENPVWEDIAQMGIGMAKAILEKSSTLDTDLYELYSSVRDYLRNTSIQLTGTQRSEAAYMMGSYRDYRRALFGNVNLTNDGLSLDTAWQELSEMHPELFDPEAREGDMPYLLLDMVQAMKPKYINEYGYDMDIAAYDLFLQIYDAYFDIPEVKTFADKKQAEFMRLKMQYDDKIARLREDSRARYDARLKTLRAENVATRRELSRKYNEAREKQHTEDMALYRKQYKALSDRTTEKLIEQRARFREWKVQDREKRAENDAVKRHRTSIEKNAQALYDWLSHPTDAKHVPETLRYTVSDFLASIDFIEGRRKFQGETSKTEFKWRERLRDLKDAMQRADDTQNSDFYAEVDPDLMPRLEAFISGTKEISVISKMDAEQLKELDFLVAIIKRTVTEANKLHANARYEKVAQVGEETISDMNKKKAAKPKGKLAEMADNLLNVEQLDSFSYFDRLGGAAKTILGGLRKGLDKKVRNVEKAMTYMETVLKDADIKKISGQRAEVKSFKVRGGELKLTKAQIMELYLLNKRKQAWEHIYGGGIKPLDRTVREGRKTLRIRDYSPINVTAEDVQKILGTLTKDEIRIADAMQKFLGDEAAAWGNEVSMTLYGYKKFTERNYYPIKSDQNYTNTQDPEKSSGFYALRNMGMTKSTVKGANNPLLLGDIFNTFTRHIDEMATYNAFVVPISDAMKWFNYRDKSASVKQSIERALGKKGQKYFENLIRDMNGVSAGDSGALDVFLRNAKAAGVGANVRVVLQQPTAYLRAAAMVSPKYLMGGGFVKGGVEKARKYAAIAQWKSWGFYDLNIGKSMREIIIGDKNLAENAREKSLWLAGKADDITWGALWGALELETLETRPELKRGSEEFNIAVGERLSDVIDRTQVVDSVFHRSQIMRGKGLTQLSTAFMAEPTKTYNMMRNAVMDYVENKSKDNAKKLARVAFALVASGIATAAAAAIADAFRDEDDEKKWLEKWLGAFVGNIGDNLNPLNLLPYTKEIMSLIEGYDAARLDLQGVAKAINMGKAWIAYLDGTSKWSLYKMMYKSVDALSGLTGIPAGNLMRTFNSAMNTFSQTGIDWENETATMGKTYNTLYAAMTEGDADKAERLREKLMNNKDSPKSPADIDVGVAGVLKDTDERIAQAYAARRAADTARLRTIRNALISEGFTGEIVDKAINLYENSLGDKEDKDLTKELDAKLYDYDDLHTAIRNAAATGRLSDARDIYAELLADSDAKDPAQAIKNEVSGAFKAEYIAYVDSGDTRNAQGLANVLTAQFGYTEENLADWVMNDKAGKMRAAIDAGDAQTANEYIVRQQELGMEQKAITQSITGKYKPLILDAYFNGEEAAFQKLLSTLTGLSLYDADYNVYYSWDRIWGWIDDYFEKGE
jgi:hypothetical protein